MKYDFESFLSVVRRIDGELQTRCPFHNDSSPSFSANVKSGLWICHAGCGQGNFDQFLQRIVSAPQGGRLSESGHRVQSFTHQTGFKVVAMYEYMDRSGAYHLRITRLQNSAGDKRFFQEHMNESGIWVKGGATKEVLPYMIHEWASADCELVFFVEGEKCADFLRGQGLKATTIPGGANKWKPYYAEHFQRKRVIILPDNDNVGWRFARDIHISLYLKKVPVLIVSLPDLGPGEDVVDWFCKGRTSSDLLKLISES